MFLADGTMETLLNPFIARDSLVWLKIRPGNPPDTTHVGVPLAQIQRVEVRKVDAALTTALVFAVAAVGVTAVLVAGSANNPSPPPPPSSPSCAGNGCLASCPQVYSWDGHDWRLDSGTFGGAIMRALARTDIDNLDYGRPDHGVLRLKVANELIETDYVDALGVLAVDHDAGFTVAPDARGRLHTIGTPILPIAARDFAGRDALPRVRALDGWNWESSLAIRDTSVAADLRDGVELSLVRPRGARVARLVVDANVTAWAAVMMEQFVALHGRATQAWYDSLAAHPEQAQRLGQTVAREAFLNASVWVDGRWERQGLVWDAGPEIVKRQVVPLDLTRVAGDTVRVRLESIPSLWLIDQVGIDYSAERPITVTELAASDATGIQGHDVRDLLASADGRPLVLEPGDSALLQFAAPAVPAGRVRTFLLRSTGWYQIATPESGEPDVATLARLEGDPRGFAKAAVTRENAALLALERAAR